MAYEVNLKEFQGPLDLLLHLIEQAEVDIKDIFISEITAQYLEYMGQIDTLDTGRQKKRVRSSVRFWTGRGACMQSCRRSLCSRPRR